MTAGGARLPHPRWRLPIIGDLLTVDLNKPCQGLAREAKTLGGIFEERIFDVPVVVVCGAEFVDEVTNETAWEKHLGHSLRKLRTIAGDGLFTAYTSEPNWAKAHNILIPAFSRAAMATYHDTMVDTVRELMDAWHRRDDWIDVPSDANRLTTEIIARVGFGHTFGKLASATDDPFIGTVLRELRYANRRTDAIPLYDKLFGRKQRRQHLADKTWLRQQVSDLISARRAARPNTDAHSDMLDTMLNSADPDTSDTLDDVNIINQILTLLVAGSETSANTIAFAVHYLAHNPDIADAARTEADERLAGRGPAGIPFEAIATLRRLRRVVDETLRLWPVAPGFFRQAKHDTALGNGIYRFAKGDWVFVLLLAAHRDPATWGADADEFNPDRFLPDRLRGLPRHVYKPFGTGPRACIGRQFALHEVMLTLAAVLHHFDLEPEPGYELTVTEALTLKPDGLRVRLHPR